MTELTEKTQEPNPLTKPKFIIAAVVLALIAILGIVLAVIPKDNGPAAAPAATPEPAVTHSAAANQSADASICGLPAGNQKKPVTAPEDAKWELVGKIATPTSPLYGPGRTESNGLRSCFAHSPTGALFSGINMVVLGSTGHNDLVTEYLTVSGPERDKMLASSPASSASGNGFQLAGFKVNEYDGARAVVEYAFKVSNGTVGSIPVAMLWQGGDWKYVPPASGHPEGKQLSDLSGFVPWAGV